MKNEGFPVKWHKTMSNQKGKEGIQKYAEPIVTQLYAFDFLHH